MLAVLLSLALQAAGVTAGGGNWSFGLPLPGALAAQVAPDAIVVAGLRVQVLPGANGYIDVALSHESFSDPRRVPGINMRLVGLSGGPPVPGPEDSGYFVATTAVGRGWWMTFDQDWRAGDTWEALETWAVVDGTILRKPLLRCGTIVSNGALDMSRYRALSRSTARSPEGAVER